jgi:hypothetical protein
VTTPSRYYSVVIPWCDGPRTPWHPIEKTGLWSTLTRGAFRNVAEATAWAEANLAGLGSYTIVQFE